CSGTSTVLTASGATTYSWSTGATTNTVSVSPTSTTVYTVTGITNGCSNTKTVSVTVNATPTVAVNNATICSGTSTVLTASGATTYSWSTGVTTNTVSVSPTSTTVYTVTGITNGCSNTKTVSVTVNATPTVAVSNATICSGTSTVLTASGATTYSWNTGSTTSTISVSPSSTTVYAVTGTTNGCSNTKTVSVTVIASPTVTAVASPTAVCPSQTVMLTAGGANTYTWSTGPTTSVTTVTPTITTTYTVTGTSTVTGCSNTKIVTAIVSPPLSVTASTAICYSQSVTLTASGATTYSWNTGPTTASISVSPTITTVYTVTGTGSGCTTTRTVQVDVKGQYCCQSASFSIGSATTTTNYSNNSNGSGAVVDVLGSITFTANSSMTNYILRMAPTASININTGVTVTFSNCTIYSCTDLWGGIFINDGVGVPGIVNVTNSRIEDMYMGITHAGANGSSTGSANFINVTNSVLNNNYISIHLRNYARANSSNGREGLSVTGTTITSQPSSTSPQLTLKTSTVYAYAYNNINNTSITYTNFPRGAVGIYLYNLEEIPVIIGDSTGTGGTNRFENLDFGVYAENASPKAFNNHFINITGSAKQVALIGFPPPPPPAGPDEIGVAFSAIITATNQVYYTRVGKVSASTPTGGNPFPGGNKFENCGKGIAITSYQEPYVKGNVFTAAETDVPPTVTPSSLYSYYKAQSAVYIKDIASNATVKNNYILNQATGIYTSHNINTSYGYATFIKIEDNLIEAPATNGYCRQAIQVDQPTSTTNLGTGLLTVKNNTIQNVYNGIKAYNVKGGLQINSNPTINLSAAKMIGVPGVTSSQINNYARTGIYVQSCTDAVVANNPNITSNGTINSSYYTAVKGIWFNTSSGTAGQVNCNTMSNMGRCLQFTGTSLNKVVKNVMNGTYQGFVLSVNGQIGDQGRTTNTTHDNEWSGFTGGSVQYAETYTESSSTANTNSRFYVKSGSPYQPTQNYSSNGFPYNTGLNLGIDVQTGLSGESCLSLRMMGGDNNEAMTMRTAQEHDGTNATLYEALASDTTFYELYQNETQYRNKQLVYELLSKQSIDTTNALNEFYNANQNSNYQAIVTINEAIAGQDYQTAQSINSGLTANNTIEVYQKRVNELLLKYLSYQPQYDTTQVMPIAKNPVFDGTELADLMTIANSCLDKYGNVITQARVLVNNVSNRIVEFEENCNPEYNQRKAATTKTVNNNTTVNVRLFPNPNKGVMTLEYDLGAEPKGEMRIFDINGKLVNVYSLQSSIGKLEINQQHLTNGVYYYSIILNGNVSKTDKIIVIK
ncbi:MAG: hypothetical protein HY062_12995, partial [Bacteroidetes bacterium]|nr:hypothetical protein [Bacteroidota bacterium]